VARELGFHVTIICPIRRIFKKRYEKILGIEIYRHPHPIQARNKIEFLIEYINAFFWELLLSIRIFCNKPFQIIHAASPPDNIFLIGFVFRLFGTKLIFDHHDLSPELYLTKFSKEEILKTGKFTLLFEKLSCKLANAIVSTNLSYKQIVINRHQINRNKVFIVRNDPILTECLLTKGHNNRHRNNKKVVLYLGSINIQDGVDILLQALHYLINDLGEKNFTCYIIGDGDSLQLAKLTAEQLGLMPFIEFKGYIYEKEKINKYLCLSDICVEPAPDNELNRHSTFIKIMEYMAAGKPIVAFDLAETKYSAKNSAIFVRPGDITGFAMAIYSLIHVSKLRQDLGKAGLERIRNQLNWEKSRLNLEKAYRSLYL